MVATGLGGEHPGLDSVETIRITEPNNDTKVEKCTKIVPNYPKKVYWAAGTTLSNGDPLLCGRGQKCYQLHANQWREAPQLPRSRSGSAMTTTANTTFISGGSDGSDLNDFDQLNGGSWQPLSPLPIRVSDHCLVGINSSYLLNIGGQDTKSWQVRK